jgi:hypothetical protein
MVREDQEEPAGWSVRKQLGHVGDLSIASVPVGQLALARNAAIAETLLCDGRDY